MKFNPFAKRVQVSAGLRLPVARHFVYTTFGVRGRYDTITRTGNYVCSGEPGTGFFAHPSDSRTYRHFVADERKKLKQSLLTLLMHKEPDLGKEYDRAGEAVKGETNTDKRRILASYQNVVSLAKEEEQLQRIVRSVKDYIKQKGSSENSSILTHYKSSIASLEHDVKAAQLNIKNELSEERLEEWGKVVAAFDLIANSRRVWSVYYEDGADCYAQVFFDLGIFDYIQSPFDTPLMRDHRGMRYFLYPKGIVAARSNIDFDIHPWSKLNVRFGVVDISTLGTRPQFNTHNKKKQRNTDALSNLYGTTRAQVVGEVLISELDLRFFVNHTGPAEDFVKALNAFNAKK